MIKIDWITIVLSVAPLRQNGLHDTVIPDILRTRLPLTYNSMRSSGEFTIGHGRRPYAFAQRAVGFTVFYSPHGENVCIEISGIGCDILRTYGGLNEVLESEHNKTRLDVALDIPTDCMPTEILEAMQSGRIKSKSIWDSPTGQTVYIGSQKSDRYLRMYRYFPPHERSKLLRLEFVLKDEYCMNTIKAMQSGMSLSDVVSGLLSVYDIAHPAISIQAAKENRVTISGNRTQNKTIVWLITQVKPAIARLKKDGVIKDVKSWVIDNLT